ncbi:uncharacterized protein F5147DRAFT_653988 [Suillus discolor]|uniref:Uncharacterized protein n=1 Tax=Suillus discolor TaxID=1912936 RepID=A0A9P7JT65_9AGAM|nr:uncharacterized protein F5147DRAFT_653988 [Suillus discolor]KAG2106243.1 hypothetical protein F5147DRAFT_653988 [Suillus discolor]
MTWSLHLFLSQSEPGSEPLGPASSHQLNSKTPLKVTTEREMSYWNSGYSGQPEEHLQSHNDGPGGPSSSLPPPQPLQWSASLPASSFSYSQPVNDSSYTNFGSQPKLTGGSQHQSGVLVPNTFHLQDSMSSSYPTLQPHSQVSTTSMFQQAVINHLHHNSSNHMQIGPQEPPLFQTSLNLASFKPSMSQAAFAYGSRNLQHAATSSQHKHKAFNIRSVPNAAAYPNYHTLYPQDSTGGSYPILLQLEPSQPGITAPETFQLQDPADGSYPTLGSYLRISTGSASQQVAANHLYHGSFEPAQNTPRELPHFPSSLNLTSFNQSTSQAASAYDSHNSQHAIGIQDQHEAFNIGLVPNHDVIAYFDYHTLHSQDTHDEFIPQNAP